MYLGAIKSLGVLSFRTFIAFAAVCIALPQLAFSEEAPDYFATHSKLSEDNIRHLLSQNACYTNEDTFVGCMQAINSIFLNTDNSLALANEATSALPQMKEVVKEVEGLSLRKLDKKYKPDSKKSNYELAVEDDLLSKRTIKAWKVLFAKTKNDQLSMERLLNEAFAQKISKYKGQTLAIAVNEFLNSAVDPHTNIHSKKGMQEMMNRKEESFSGVGMQLYFDKDQKIVLLPIEGSPALAAGVRKKDILTHIDGKPASTNYDDFLKYSNLLKGEANSKVTITVLRKGQSINLTITRGQISLKVLEGKILTNSKTNQKLGYIRLLSFMQVDLCRDFVTLAKTLHSQGAESLILDVRNNGGGDLREVVCMASTFIDANQKLLQFRDPYTNVISGQISNTPVEVKTKDGFIPQAAELYNLYNRKPLVIMQNAHSASASELLPGAIQAHGRVVTVGERSFGKGTMQEVGMPAEAVGLDNIEGILLAMTVARFHFADGSTNQLKGILPDFEVFSKPNATDEDKYAKREADLYTNAISAGIKRPPGIPSAVKTSISTCMAANSNIAAEYAQDEESALGGDYQLTNAKAVASCLPEVSANLMLANF